MSEDSFDDGLIHTHHWASTPARTPDRPLRQVADASAVRTPSSVYHDDRMELPL